MSELDALLLAEDPHDRALVAAAHPAGWENPRPRRRYDLVVVGGGTAGLVAAAGAAGLGARVALVERRLLGGDCLNFGCVPSKALIASARAAAAVRAAARYGVQAGEPQVDGRAVMERVRRLRAEIAPHDSAARFRELGVDVFLGAGRFVAPRAVEVAGARLEFAKACVATGARPVVPSIDGLEPGRALTNETLFRLEAPPRRLAILGGGPIGCELAQAFARLGSEVHLIERAGRLLAREPADAARLVQAAIGRDGARLYLERGLARVEPLGRALRLHLEPAAAPLEVDELLVAVGRAPNVEGLGLEAAGVRYDARRGVEVDDFLRTTNRHVYAAGDVASALKFTHLADAHARLVLRNALFPGRARASALNVPWCTYTDPELAHTGLTADEARVRGHELEILRLDLGELDRARLDGDEGFLELRLETGRDRLLGATLVAPRAGELISELTAWMAAKRGLRGLANVVHPYPTQAELFRRAGDLLTRRAFKPWMREVVGRWLALRR